jgi:hypothetical protein
MMACVVPLVSAHGETSVRHLLNSNVPSTKFDNVPLSDCIDFLHDVSGANIVVDWKTLNAASITKDAPINLRVKNTSLEQVLNLILTQASTTDNILTFYIDRDVIQVTTKTEADKHVYTIVYDVRDLLITVPNFTLSTNTGGGGGYGGSGGGYGGGGYGGGGYGGGGYGGNTGGFGGGGFGGNSGGFGGGGFGGNSGGFGGGGFGGGGFGGNSGGFGGGGFGNNSGGGFGNNSSGSSNGFGNNSSGSNGSGSGSNNTDQQAQSLIKLIEAVVQPDAWSDNGGTTAYISEWNGTLIVTAPRPILEAIGGAFD